LPPNTIQYCTSSPCNANMSSSSAAAAANTQGPQGGTASSRVDRQEQARKLKLKERKDSVLYIPYRCETCGKIPESEDDMLFKCERCSMALYCNAECGASEGRLASPQTGMQKNLTIYNSGVVLLTITTSSPNILRVPKRKRIAISCRSVPLRMMNAAFVVPKKNLERTECCGNWICNTEEDYQLFSYSREFCSRSHNRYTTCTWHCTEEHGSSVDWRECKECMKDSTKNNVRSWNSTNGYNFTPGLMAAYPKGSMITAECCSCHGRIATGFEAHVYSPSVNGPTCKYCNDE
jgi:hypothetical protein